MGTPYETDVLAWATEQVALLRAGKLSEIDIEHIAEEIEDVGKSEKRELKSRMVVLIAHLLKWQFQPERRGSSWQKTIKVQRRDVKYCLKETPSLQGCFNDPEWLAIVWDVAVVTTENETGLQNLPDKAIWSPESILSDDFYPDN